MKKNRLVAAWMLLSLSLVLGAVVCPASKAEDSPKVLKAVPPTHYPPLAAAAMVSGKVKVEVKIDPTGDVISAKIIKGPKLLGDTARAAALRWKFERSEEVSRERTVQLTFTFVHWTRRKEQERGKTRSIPPYKIEIVGSTVTIQKDIVQ